ncbi:MAG: chloride channel protein [Chthoniobacter sp.]
MLLLKVVVASAAFGLASTLFAELSHRLSALFKKLIAFPPLRPAVGGVLVIGLFFLAGTPDYLGLGVWSADPHAITIPSFFTSPEIHRGAGCGRSSSRPRRSARASRAGK